LCIKGGLLGLEIAYWMFTRKKITKRIRVFQVLFLSCFRDEESERMTCFDAFWLNSRRETNFITEKLFCPFFGGNSYLMNVGLAVNDLVTLVFFFLSFIFFSLDEIDRSASFKKRRISIESALMISCFDNKFFAAFYRRFLKFFWWNELFDYNES